MYNVDNAWFKLLEQTLKTFKQMDLPAKLKLLDVKPQTSCSDYLNSSSCEAGGKVHTEHFASIHRPE